MKNLHGVSEQAIPSYPLSRILQISTESNCYQGKLMQIGMTEGSKRKMNMPFQWQKIRELTSDGISTTPKTMLQAEERRRLFELKNANIMKMPLCRQNNANFKRANSEGKKPTKSKLESIPGSELLLRNFQNKVEESEDVKLRKQMMRVERWLEECQKYQEFWMREQEDDDDEDIAISCPTWMKTATEMRRTRVSRRCNMRRGANSGGGGEVVIDKNVEIISGRTEDKINSPSFEHESIQSHFDSISGSASECKTGQSTFSLISQGRHKETRLVQRIEKTGADLSMIFEDGGDADEAIVITCCFEKCENEFCQDPTGILTRRKIRKLDSGSMGISSKDTNSEV